MQAYKSDNLQTSWASHWWQLYWSTLDGWLTRSLACLLRSLRINSAHNSTLCPPHGRPLLLLLLLYSTRLFILNYSNNTAKLIVQIVSCLCVNCAHNVNGLKNKAFVRCSHRFVKQSLIGIQKSISGLSSQCCHFQWPLHWAAAFNQHWLLFLETISHALRTDGIITREEAHFVLTIGNSIDLGLLATVSVGVGSQAHLQFVFVVFFGAQFELKLCLSSDKELQQTIPSSHPYNGSAGGYSSKQAL